MATKKAGLPEASVSAERLAPIASKMAQLIAIKERLDAVKSEEETVINEIRTLAENIRREELTNGGKYIGIIRVPVPGSTAGQVQFKLDHDTAIGTDRMAFLDELYGMARPQLFEKCVAVPDPKGVLTPEQAEAFYQEAKAKGANPWDTINAVTKKGCDKNFVGYESVELVEAVMPKEGFLATSNELHAALPAKAKEHLADYIEKTVGVTVKPGNRGTASQA